jgi:hypothetical protein
MSIPRIHNQEQTIMGHLSAYASVGSSPKAPLDPGTAAFVKGEPPITQAAEMTQEQFRAEARAVLKSLDTLAPRLLQLAEMFDKRWREFAPTRDLACDDIFGCSLGALRHRVNRWKDILESQGLCDLTAEEDKKNTLTQIADLPLPAINNEAPDPLDTMPTRTATTTTSAPPAPAEAPKPQAAPAAVPERQPRERNDSGKPIWAMPAWKELTEAIGRAINRNDAVNHLLRSPEDHKYIHDCLSNAFDRADGWREKAKHV